MGELKWELHVYVQVPLLCDIITTQNLTIDFYNLNMLVRPSGHHILTLMTLSSFLVVFAHVHVLRLRKGANAAHNIFSDRPQYK